MSKANWILSAGLVLGISALIAAAPPGEADHRRPGHGHPQMPDATALSEALEAVPDQVLARVVRAVPGAAIVAIEKDAVEDGEPAADPGYEIHLKQRGIPISAHVDAEGHITRLETHAPPPPRGGQGFGGMQGPPRHGGMQGPGRGWQGPSHHGGHYGPPPPSMPRSGFPMFSPPPMQMMQGIQPMPGQPCEHCQRRHHGGEPMHRAMPAHPQMGPPPRGPEPSSWNTPYSEPSPYYGYETGAAPSLFEPELTIP